MQRKGAKARSRPAENLHRDNAVELVLRLVRYLVNLPIRLVLRVFAPSRLT